MRDMFLNYFSLWTVILFGVILVMGFLQSWFLHVDIEESRKEFREQIARQEEIWRRLFEKADNTERMTQQILTRLADENIRH